MDWTITAPLARRVWVVGVLAPRLIRFIPSAMCLDALFDAYPGDVRAWEHVTA